MANIEFPDPALTHNFAILAQSNEGQVSVTVRFAAPNAVPPQELSPASFGHEEMSGPELAANAAAVALLIAKAKARQEAMALARGDTITWTVPA